MFNFFNGWTFTHYYFIDTSRIIFTHSLFFYLYRTGSGFWLHKKDIKTNKKRAQS